MSERSARIAVLVGGGLVALGAFLPWASAGLFQITGLQGDGVFAILLGVGILALMAASFANGPSAGVRGLILLFSVGALVLYVFEFMNVSDRSGTSEILSIQVGSGILLGAIGALISVLASSAIGRRVVPS